MRTVSRLYDNYADAVTVVTELEGADLNSDRKISLVANENARGRDTTVETQRTETSNAGPGAGAGAAVGGIVGLLTGLGVMAIPGIGPSGGRWLACDHLGRRRHRGGRWGPDRRTDQCWRKPGRG